MRKWITHDGITIIRLDGFRCNCFVIQHQNKNWLIDTSTLMDRKRIVSQLEENGIHEFAGIILTHSHINHVEAASWYMTQYQCPVYIHDSELHFIQTGDCLIPKAARKSMEPIERIVSYIPFLNKYPPCREAQVLPLGSELFEDDRIKVIETPGHSEGSISIVVDDEIAIVGDVMRKKAIFSVFLAWANQPGLVAVSWKKLLQENCNLFLPSHGREITRELLEKELDEINS